MPQIIVTALTRDPLYGTVLLRERITLTDLESEHFRRQLVQRLGWAVSDAHTVEHAERAPGRCVDRDLPADRDSAATRSR